MSSKKSDVIGGFNEFINGQKEITADSASAIFVKFNSTVTVVHDAKPIDEAVELSPMTYRPAGQTALFDAIWDGVRLGEKKEAEFDRVICLIMTDGEENASRKITSAGIRNLLKIKEDEGKWTFLYIGENPERWATQTGISTGNVAQYDHVAPRQNFHSSIQAVSLFRNEMQSQQPQLMQRIQPMPQNSFLTQLTNPMTPTPGIPGMGGIHSMMTQQLNNRQQYHNSAAGTVSNRVMTGAAATVTIRPQTPPPPYSECQKN